MIKRILVALDPSSQTEVATRFSIDLATANKARLTGLAVVNTEQISSEVGAGGIGTIYYAEKLRSYLSKKSRDTASQLVDRFKSAVGASGLKHSEMVEEGVPFERIIEDMKYYDLLVMGRDPHFYYNKPDEKTKTLGSVVKKGIAPVLVVNDEHHEVHRVLLANDGSDACARTMQAFAHLQPFGTNLEIEIANVFNDAGDSSEDEQMSHLQNHLAATYLRSHGYAKVNEVSLAGTDVGQTLCKYAEEKKVDMLVAGAHAVSAIQRLTFGSTTAYLLKNSPSLLFVQH